MHLNVPQPSHQACQRPSRATGDHGVAGYGPRDKRTVGERVHDEFCAMLAAGRHEDAFALAQAAREGDKG